VTDGCEITCGSKGVQISIFLTALGLYLTKPNRVDDIESTNTTHLASPNMASQELCGLTWRKKYLHQRNPRFGRDLAGPHHRDVIIAPMLIVLESQNSERISGIIGTLS